MRLAVLAILCVSTAAFAETPADRAKAFVTKQLDAVTKDDDAAFKATFTADAMFIGFGTGSVFYDAYADPIAQLGTLSLDVAFTGGSPHVNLKKTKIEKLVAGGDANVMWLSADIVATFDGQEPGYKKLRNQTHRTRMTELVVADGSTWKAVAATFTVPGPTSSGPATNHNMIGKTTAAGPLAPLAASPSKLIEKLSADKNVFVIGTDKNEKAVGLKAAKKLLGQWSKLKLTIDEKSVREVATKTYAFAQVSVTYTTTKNDQALYHDMVALIMAVPNGNDWSVVGVHYINGN